MVLSTTKWFNRFVVALGGFLIFVGIIVVGVFILDFLSVIDLRIIETENLQGLFFCLLLAIGLIDLIAGLLLWPR